MALIRTNNASSSGAVASIYPFAISSKVPSGSEGAQLNGVKIPTMGINSVTYSVTWDTGMSTGSRTLTCRDNNNNSISVDAATGGTIDTTNIDYLVFNFVVAVSSLQQARTYTLHFTI